MNTMEQVRLVVILALSVLVANSANAQSNYSLSITMKSKDDRGFSLGNPGLHRVNAFSNHSLIGEWETAYDVYGEKGFATYEIKSVDGRLKGYTQYVEDEKGNGQNYASLVLEDILWSTGKGRASYVMKYQGKTYATQVALTLVDANTLNAHYSYNGYSNNETWTRVK